MMDEGELEESERLTSTAVFDPKQSRVWGEITKCPEREISQLWESLTAEKIGNVHAVQSD